MIPKTRHPLFHVWRMMLRRCSDPKDPAYPYYGGRGITVCQRWRDSFDAFCDDIGPRPLNHTVDRKDNDGPYTPGNCKWSTKREQVLNSSRVHLLTFAGKTMTLTAWAQETGLSLPTLSGRLRRGWSTELILTTPARVGQRVRQRNVLPLLEQSGLSHSTFYARLARGWSLEEAATTPRHQGQRHVEPVKKL
jgi:hypothetical protein